MIHKNNVTLVLSNAANVCIPVGMYLMIATAEHKTLGIIRPKGVAISQELERLQ